MNLARRATNLARVETSTLPLDNADFLVPRRRHAGLDNPTPEQAREAFAYLDGRHPLLGSSYEEPTWTLSSIIKWIAERTRDVVDGLSVDEEAAQIAVAELQNALECGEVRASAVS